MHQRFYPNAVETRSAVDDCLNLQGRCHGRRGKFHHQSATVSAIRPVIVAAQSIPNIGQIQSKSYSRTSSVSYEPKWPCCGIVELLVDDDFGGFLSNPPTQDFKVRFCFLKIKIVSKSRARDSQSCLEQET
jgi:hypothetical protein